MGLRGEVHQGEKLWNPQNGDSYSVFNVRPLPVEFIEHCIGDGSQIFSSGRKSCVCVENFCQVQLRSRFRNQNIYITINIKSRISVLIRINALSC